MSKVTEYQEIETLLTNNKTMTVNPDATQHQITVEMQSATTITTGTLALAVKQHGATEHTPLKNSAGDLLELDMTAGPHTIRFDGKIVSVEATPTDYDGDTYSLNAQGW